MTINTQNLNLAIEMVQEGLRTFSTSLEAQIVSLFGTGVKKVLADLGKGDFRTIPPVEVLSSSQLNGANGAFAAQTNRIYVSAEFLAISSPEQITRLLLEEIGHKIDICR